MARPQRPHKCSWDGKLIQGLYRCADGRWRNNATREKFTEPDERRAVARFLALQPAPALAALPVATLPTREGMGAAAKKAVRRDVRITVPRSRSEPVTVERMLPASEVWSMVRDEITMRPDFVARMLEVSESRIRELAIPKPSLKLSAIITNYKTHNPATEKAKKEALNPLNKLIDRSEARTLDDLTTVVFLAFKKHVESSVPGPATRRAYYARIKSVIAFGLKTGMDAEQIRPALDRAKVLWTAEALPPVDPRPISRENFHTLLDAGNGSWRPWLLLGLNLCLHMEEVCGLKWEHIDLERGTYAAIRGKTKRQRIPRAGVLWPESIAELRKIVKRGPYVFISTRGTRYNRNTRVNDFRELRENAGLPDGLTFDSLRDGSYTAACQGTTDERLARVLAGHKAGGLQDNYVLRNPAMVRPACEAVYRTYGPFPVPAAR